MVGHPHREQILLKHTNEGPCCGVLLCHVSIACQTLFSASLLHAPNNRGTSGVLDYYHVTLQTTPTHHSTGNLLRKH